MNYEYTLVHAAHYAVASTHQYNASFGCGKLEQDPFVSVGSPHAEAVSFRQSNRQQPGCSLIHLQALRGHK